MLHPVLCSVLGILPLGPLPRAAAQTGGPSPAARRAQVLRPARPLEIDPRAHRPDLLVLKFVEGHRVRLDESGAPYSPTGLPLEALRRLRRRRRLERVFTRSVADLERERRTLMASATAGTYLPDINNYYYLHTRGLADSRALLAALSTADGVEIVYPAPLPPAPRSVLRAPAFLPDIPPTTPNFESKQAYFGATPTAFGHLLTRGVAGAEGIPSLLVIHIEGAWVLGHEDLPNLVTKNIIGQTDFGKYMTPNWYQHGTAMAGLLNAERNAYGTRGFAPMTRFRMVSLVNGRPNMINLATAKAKAGDVFVSAFGYLVLGKDAPVDYYQANFDAILIATAKGISYVIAAGNSGEDLARQIVYGNRYAKNAKSSGAFIIGATGAGDYARLSFSNYGDKVVANGWGAKVVTTGGIGDLFRAGNDERQHYTQSFGGTSSATGIVAGVIASLQSASIRQNGKVLTPAAIRQLLRSYGTAISGNIGKRPDLPAMFAAAGILDGLKVTREANLGNSFDLELRGKAGNLWALLASPFQGETQLGLNRRLLIDLKTFIPLAAGQISRTGENNLSFNVPNDQSLIGKSFFAQSLELSTSSMRLTNSIEVFINY